MANKPLDGYGQSDKMHSTTPQGEGGEQGRDYLRDNPPDGWGECGQCGGHHPPGFTADCRDDVNRWPSEKCIAALSVIITPEPEDVATCLWCSVNPVSPDHDPYCCAECADASRRDDEVN